MQLEALEDADNTVDLVGLALPAATCAPRLRWMLRRRHAQALGGMTVHLLCRHRAGLLRRPEFKAVARHVVQHQGRGQATRPWREVMAEKPSPDSSASKLWARPPE